MDRKLLGIYLNDHLTAATAVVELARRARASNEGTALGEFLDGLVRELEDDRSSLERVMARLGVRKDLAKVAAGWTGEKLGRLKLNGRLTGYSPLSRVVELEGLLLLVESNGALWRALGKVLGTDEFKPLADRSRRQRTALERRRVQAVDDALVGSAT